MLRIRGQHSNAEKAEVHKDMKNGRFFKGKTIKEKLNYFADYYLVQTVAVLLAVGLIGYFVKTIAFDRKDVVLSVMILNDNEEMDIDLLEKELKEYLGTTSNKQDITFSFMRTDVAQNEAIILTRLRAKTVDIIISDEETFQKYAGSGIYAELSSVVDAVLLEQNKDKLLRGSVAIWDRDGKKIGEEKPADYGWNLADSEKYVTLGGINEKPVFGIVVNGMNGSNAAEALHYFLERD